MKIPFIQKRSPKSDYPVYSQSNMKVIVIAYFHQKAAIYQLASCFLCALLYPDICKQSSFIMMSSPHLTLLYVTQKIKVNNECHKNMRTNFKLFPKHILYFMTSDSQKLSFSTLTKVPFLIL